MKKLLSILGAMTLIGTASTSVIACGGENPTPPTPDTKIDISDKITSSIALGELSENTAADFLAKLQEKLITLTDLSTITTNDYDVYKAGAGIVSITSGDIISGTSLNIKIIAKGDKFKGTKDSIVANYNKADTKIDISDKITSSIALGELSENTAADFLAKLQEKLITLTDLSTITTNDYDVYKAGAGIVSITSGDIISGTSLNIKIIAKGDKFKGTKDSIVANYNKADTKIDISDKITSSIALGELSENTAADFLAKLQEKLITLTDLSTITTNDYDVYKAGAGIVSITSGDIISGTSLNIKIIAKGDKFKGTKDSIVANYNKADTKIDLSNIEQVTEFNFVANTTQKNDDDNLWARIFEAPELKEYKDLIQFEGKWFKEVFSASDEKITSNSQKPGIIYIVINVQNNPYCEGKTKKMKVTLN